MNNVNHEPEGEPVEQQKYIKTKPLCIRLGGVTPRTLQNWQKKKVCPFPAPSITGSGCTNRWLLSDIIAWENAQNQNSPTIDSNRENQAA